MTAQIPDVLIHRGKRLALCADSLYDYLKKRPKSRQPKFRWVSTALMRGYVATWEIVDRRLYLVGLEGTVQTDHDIVDVDLSAVFPRRRPPIPATWVSDVLRCPEGRLRQYVHAGFGSTYERDREFLVREGVVEEEFLIFNPPAPLVYVIEPDGRRTYLDGDTRYREDIADDPFPADAPVEPWRVWGQPDWDVAGGEGWFLGGELVLGRGRETDG